MDKLKKKSEGSQLKKMRTSWLHLKEIKEQGQTNIW